MSLSARLLVSVLALAGAVLFGYGWGSNSARNEAKAEKLTAVQRAIDQAAEIASQDAAVSERQEQTREHIRVVYHTIMQEVEKNVAKNPQYVDCGLDADGLRDWNAANEGNPVDSTSQRDAGMSGSASGTGRQAANSDPQPRESSPALPRLPGAQ